MASLVCAPNIVQHRLFWGMETGATFGKYHCGFQVYGCRLDQFTGLGFGIQANIDVPKNALERGDFLLDNPN